MTGKSLFGFIAKITPTVLLAAGVLGVGVSAFADVKDGANHQVEQTGLIQMGTSGGSISDYGNLSVVGGSLFGSCCGGTLGALVTAGSKTYIMSNNHVLARVNLTDVNWPVGTPQGFKNLDDSIIHPGLIDQGKGDDQGGSDGSGTCTADSQDVVADDPPQPIFVPMVLDDATPNLVDVAVAEANTAVDLSGAILDIGQPHVTPYAGELLNLNVTKSGRTTGQTFGKVVATNVTIRVGYSVECGSSEIVVGRFIHQIRIRGKGKFANGGDSGSFIVTDDANHQPVGLLFAGGSRDTFANDIMDVLDELSSWVPGGSVSVVGSNAPLAPADDPVEESGGPPPDRGNGRFLPSGGIDPLGLEIASEVKARHEDRLFEIPEVVGTGISVDRAGNPVIEVYLEGGASRAIGPPIPNQLEGISVRVVETGPIRAF